MDPPVAGEQPQPQTQTVPAGGEQPQRQEPADVSASIDALTDATAIGDLLFGRTPEPPADAEPAGPASGDTPTPQAGTDSTADDPAGEQPQDAAEDPDTTPAEPQQAPSLDRISLRSLHPDDRLLVAQAKDMVREGKAPRLADAIKMLTETAAGTPEPAPEAHAQAATQDPQPDPAPARQPAPAVEPDADVAALAAQLADLRAQRKAAVEEFDRPTELELTSQIEDALAALAEAKSQAALRSREATLQDQAINAVIEDIYVAHPDSEDPKSYFSYRLTQEVESYEQAYGSIRNHPAQLKALADKVAKEIAPPPAARTQAPAPAPRQNARPLGTGAPGSASAVRPSPDNIERLIQTSDEETIRAVLFGA
jgi:DNA polymerase III subunit gamma/tau